MKEQLVKLETTEVLDYDIAGGRASRNWVWPFMAVGLGFFQFPWALFASMSMMTWDGPKRLVLDSLFMLLTATPTIAAILSSILTWRRFSPRGQSSASRDIAICVFVISFVVLCGLIYKWFSDMLLNTNPRWYPI